MYLYNITFNIDENVVQEWLKWVQSEHIPEVLNNSPFTQARLIKVLIQEEMGGQTFSIQYEVAELTYLELFFKESKFDMFAEMKRLFSGKFVSFSTELQVIHDFTQIKD